MRVEAAEVADWKQMGMQRPACMQHADDTCNTRGRRKKSVHCPYLNTFYLNSNIVKDKS